MMRHKQNLLAGALASMLLLSSSAVVGQVRKSGKPIKLFNGKDLKGFDADVFFRNIELRLLKR